ncbi:MAG: hypothetical protein JW874_08705 [Spirochaetales bacterium]|nr:hypothetical protein [Spirochaetales bacterium]
MKRFKSLFLLLLCAVPALTAQNFIIPDISSTNDFHSLAFSQKKDFLITGDEKGNLQVWSIKDHSLVRSYPVSRLAISKIAVHPKSDLVAIVETNNINLTFLSVMDWTTGAVIYSKPLKSVPLELQFSPRGTYIVYSTQDWDSLHFLEASTGKATDIMNKGIGIIPAFYISESEKTILTYNLIGSLQYWTVKNGALKGEYPTIANLRNVAFHEDATYIAGNNDRELLVINPTNGKVVRKTATSTLRKLSVQGELILGIHEDTIQSWKYDISGNNLESQLLPGARYEANVNDFIYNNSNIYTATEKGIFLTALDSELHLPYGNVPLMDITSITAENNTLVITGKEQTLLITHPLVSGKFTSEVPPLMQSLKTPELENSDLIYYKDGNFFVYNRSGNSGRFAFLSIENGFSEILNGLKAPLVTAKYLNNRLLLLSKTGNIRLFSQEEGFYPFEHTSAGIHDVVMTSGGSIISSRTKTPQYNYSLVSINLETGETFPIENSNSIINKLEIDEHTNTVYSLGYMTIEDMIYTVVKSHGLNGTGNEKTLQKVFGNYPESTFSFDRNTGRLFTSLEDASITGIRSFSIHTYYGSAGIPQKIVPNRNCLISLNTNDTLSFWNIMTGRYLGSLYIFGTGGWAFVTDEGKLAYEGTTSRNFNAYRAGSTNPVTLDKLLINWSTQ